MVLFFLSSLAFLLYGLLNITHARLFFTIAYFKTNSFEVFFIYKCSHINYVFYYTLNDLIIWFQTKAHKPYIIISQVKPPFPDTSHTAPAVILNVILNSLRRYRIKHLDECTSNHHHNNYKHGMFNNRLEHFVDLIPLDVLVCY